MNGLAKLEYVSILADGKTVHIETDWGDFEMSFPEALKLASDISSAVGDRLDKEEK